ncbi:MAG: GGDEF domain-containing protein, partial [Burkholderiales bacterium PBB5]
GRYLERAGYAADAYAAYRRHRTLADEVFRRDQQQAIVELQEGFDNQRRQRDLDLLQRDNRLKQTELDNHTLQQRVWATAVVAGVLLLGVAAMLLRRLRHHSAALAEGNARLRTQSEIDPLTGLANRRHLLRRMQPEGVPGAPFTGALLLVDLDHFKRINDQHGHAVGDEVLVEAARRLQAALREDDLVVRWGGEEFLVVSPVAEPAVLQLLAERLLVALAGMPVATANGPLSISASIGFAGFPLAPSGVVLDWERAVDLVDTALYLAKAHGRNRAYGVRTVQTDSAPALRELSRRLEAAWREGEVTLTALTGPALPAQRHDADGVTA